MMETKQCDQDYKVVANVCSLQGGEKKQYDQDRKVVVNVCLACKVEKKTIWSRPQSYSQCLSSL